MRNYLFFLFTLVGVTANAADPGFRLFTDPQGREMQAKLTRVSGDDVYIERQDGLATKVDISIFSPDDQAYIRDWEKKDAWSRKLELRFKSHITDRKGWDGHPIARKTWKEGYEIVVKNETAFAMEDVRLEYRVFKFEDAMAAQKRSEGEVKKIKGAAKVKNIPAWSEEISATSQFPMRETKLASGYYWTGGGKKKSRDYMEGVWVRVYVGDSLAHETTQPKNLNRNAGWD